ncbi:hypothetical protein [Nocardiopsis salina]|uniref:hypothetical protein n=1 Tax=Nocardiopsis salina TaxID=245836 RepID=UPI000348C166|nr:hypothetical protein [Nocardiopsis salina]
MFNPIALLYLLMRMFRASQGVHTSPFGWFRELRAEWTYRQRSRRVRRYAERIPAASLEPRTEPWVGADREPDNWGGAATEHSPWLSAPEPSDSEFQRPELPGPRVPSPRRPSDADSSTTLTSQAAHTSHATHESLGTGLTVTPQARIPATATAAAPVNVSVPAAIVRGRCFVSGRATGARPVESRRLALAVLCALADQERAGQHHSPTHGPAHAGGTVPAGGPTLPGAPGGSAPRSGPTPTGGPAPTGGSVLTQKPLVMGEAA